MQLDDLLLGRRRRQYNNNELDTMLVYALHMPIARSINIDDDLIEESDYLALIPVILCTVCRCFAAFWTCLCPVFKNCCFAIFQLVYLNHGGENRTTYSAFDN